MSMHAHTKSLRRKSQHHACTSQESVKEHNVHTSECGCILSDLSANLQYLCGCTSIHSAEFSCVLPWYFPQIGGWRALLSWAGVNTGYSVLENEEQGNKRP